MSNKVGNRSEAMKKFTWATEDIFPNDDAWQEALLNTRKLSDEAAAYAGRLGESAQTLYDFCVLEEKLSEKIRDVYGYASRKSDEDKINALYQSFDTKAMNLFVECNAKISFATPEIIAIADETMESFLEEKKELERYRRSLGEIRRIKEHCLSPEMEKLLADAKEMANGPDTAYSMLNNADMTFPSAKDALGEEHEVTHGTFIPLMQSGDRVLRKSAFESLYHTYESLINTSASLLSSQVSQLKFFAKARKYSSTLEASLNVTNVPVEVYKNLIETVHNDIGYLHKYMKLRKKLLGVDELHMYDVYTPMLPDVDVKVPYEEAKKNVLEATAVLGEEYTSILKEGFENRWIDVYENKGKRSGAYSAGERVHPFVLLNYADTLDSEFTLAHEMGHALHSYLSRKYQNPCDSDYVIFVAEVASTCNEALLMQYLLKKSDDKMVRANLLNYFLEQFRTTLYRQTMFAEFEMMINEASERGEALTAEKLNQMYHDLNVFYYGEDVVIDREIDFEWARIPHFYYNFYVFQYATGFSAAMALSEKILKGGEQDVKDYLTFLSGGCSKDPISLLRGAGVDMQSPQPVHNALKLFDALIDELDELLG